MSMTEIKKSFVLTKKEGDKVNVYVYNLAESFDEKTALNLNNESEFEFYNVENDHVSTKTTIKYDNITMVPSLTPMQRGNGQLKKRRYSKKHNHKRIKIKTIKIRKPLR
jgi:hypothetical protein